MSKRRTEKELEQWFDGELDEAAFDESRIENDPDLSVHLAVLRALRSGARQAVPAPAIADAQFPAFMAGIREGIEAPRARLGGFWAYASIVTAALIVSVSLLVIFSQGPANVKAQTEVESVSSDIEGATFDTHRSEDGSATIWINTAGEDLW